MSSLIGQSLGRYHILEQLGVGGMATVYKTYDTRLERHVAVKVILPQRRFSEKFLKRFEREAKALAKLSNPNIVKVLDYGEHEGLPYLVMEYLPGGTLKEKLTSRPMPWQEAAHLILPIASALECAHQQKIVHRDIKPSNILLTQSGEPMLSDFGIAKILESEETQTLTGTGMGVGTPEYMAPEQWTGQVTPQPDIYSLGVVFYEMVTGRKPYKADTPPAIMLKQATEPLPRPAQYVPGLPDGVEKVLLKALARKPEDRYSDMAAFADGLDHLFAGQPKAKKQPDAIAKATPPKAEPVADTKGTILQEETYATRLQGATQDELPPTARIEMPAWLEGDAKQIQPELAKQKAEKSPPSRKMNWSLLIWWILASIGGSIGGWAVVAAVLSVGDIMGFWQIGFTDIAPSASVSYSASNLAFLGTFGGVAAAIVGAMIGTGQWLVLRRQINKTGLWIVITMAGWAVSWALCLPIISIPALSSLILFVGGMVGITTGVGQWLVLRRQLRMAGLWILAAIIGGVIDCGLCGFFSAIATGFTLIWLLRDYSPTNPLSAYPFPYPLARSFSAQLLANGKLSDFAL